VHTSSTRSFVDIVAKWVSQMRAVVSPDAVTMRAPSGAEGGREQAVLVSTQDRDLFGGGGVPDARGVVV